MAKSNFFRNILLLSIFGPLGLVMSWFIGFNASSATGIRRFYRLLLDRNWLGGMALILGMLGISLAILINKYLSNLGIGIELPAMADPRNLGMIYTVTGILLMLGGTIVLLNIEFGKWIILLGSLTSFIFTVLPSLVIAEAMMDVLKPIWSDLVDSLFQGLGQLFPEFLAIMDTSMGPLIKFYVISMLITVPLLDVIFIIIIACACVSFKPESVYDEDIRTTEEYKEFEWRRRSARLYRPNFE